MGAYMHLMYVFVWRGGGGSTQTNIDRLKQNVDNWRRPLSLCNVRLFSLFPLTKPQGETLGKNDFQ